MQIPFQITQSSLLTGKKQALKLMSWLVESSGTLKPEEISPYLGNLLEIYLLPTQKLYLLENLFARFEPLLEEQITPFVGISIPLNQNAYRRVNTLLDVMGDFALGYESVLTLFPDKASEDEIQLCLKRMTFLLYQHLFVSYLTGRPASLGIWQRLHSAYLYSRKSTRMPPDKFYIEALLLAIAHPASFVSRDLAAAAHYVRQQAPFLHFTETQLETSEAAFWIPLQQDFYAFPMKRRMPPPDTRAFYFSCKEIVIKAKEHLCLLEENQPWQPFMPLATNARSCRQILQQLINRWGDPDQRRYPRHRKYHRGRLCMGLNHLHTFLDAPENLAEDNFSHWIITNESPDGYTLMFSSGTPGHISVGNIILLQQDPKGNKPESSEGNDPQDPFIGLIRWAISETPEHIEVGVQVLATKAYPVTLIDPDFPDDRVTALLLPEKSATTANTPCLIIPSNTLNDQNTGQLLIEEKGAHAYPIHALNCHEQNRYVDIFRITKTVPPISGLPDEEDAP